MSALLENTKPTTTTRRAPAKTQERVHSRPNSAPAVVLKARIYERPRSRPSVAGIILGKVALFALFMGMTYATLSLIGHVKVESARQERLDARARAIEAQRAEALIAVRVDKLTSSSEIEKFALAQNMVMTTGFETEPRSEAIVASR